MQTLKFLGRGSAFNESEPKNSAYYKEDDTLLLIDCGNKVLDKIKRLKLLDGVKTLYVLITHIHKDHVYDLPALLKYTKDREIDTRIVKTLGIDEKALFHLPELEGHEYEKYTSYKLKLSRFKDYDFIDPKDANLLKFAKVDSFIVPHVNYFISCALSLKIGDSNIFYSGDCNKIPFDIKGYDEYYFEYSLGDGHGVHLSMDELEKIVRRNNINKEKVRLMHLEGEESVTTAMKNGYKVASLEA